MITLLLHLLRLLPFLFDGHRQLALENLALRQQLVVYKRTVPRPRLRTTDRLLWVGLATVWAGWRQALVIVWPNTVLRWQRRRFPRALDGALRSPSAGPSAYQRRDRRPHQKNGRDESLMGCAENPR